MVNRRVKTAAIADEYLHIAAGDFIFTYPAWGCA